MKKKSESIGLLSVMSVFFSFAFFAVRCVLLDFGLLTSGSNQHGRFNVEEKITK